MSPRALDAGERRALAAMARQDRGPDDGLRRRLGAASTARCAGTPAYLDRLLAREPLGAGEEALAARAAAGDPSARERLVEALLPRIVGLARRLAGSADFADLVQEGVLGALEGLARYDPARGTPFWAYAGPWVRGAMLRLAQDHRRAMRLPPRALAELSALKEAAAELRAEGREAPLGLVAERAGLSRERAEALASAAARPRSLQEPASEAGGPTLADVLPDPTAAEAYDAVVERAGVPELAALLGALRNRERDVLVRRVGLGGGAPESLSAVAERLGVSRERVRQIEARAIRKLRGE